MGVPRSKLTRRPPLLLDPSEEQEPIESEPSLRCDELSDIVEPLDRLEPEPLESSASSRGSLIRLGSLPTGPAIAGVFPSIM